MPWFDRTGDCRLERCATDNCGGAPIYRLEADGVGSNYCSGCRAKIEGAAALRSQAEANVLAVRSWDSPGFPACVTREMEKMKAARAITPMQVRHANEAWNAQPPDASEDDRMKAALETLGASPSPSALTANEVVRQFNEWEPPREPSIRDMPSAYISVPTRLAAGTASALTEEGVTEGSGD